MKQLRVTPTDVLDAGWLMDPAGFLNRLTKGHYQVPRWIDFTSRIIAAEFAKGGARIVISAPPQFGKSRLCAEGVPPWALERDPSNKAIVASYGSELAARSVRAGRDLVRENESSLRIRMGKSAEDYWESIPGGGRTPGYVRAVGVGSGTTGFGIDTGVIDDPYKDADEAFSEAYRAKVEEWFWSVFMTRLSKRANVLSIATRWHTRDLTSKLIEAGWLHIHLPALAEENDPLGRAPGESLWEEHKPRAWLLALRDGTQGDGRGAMPPRYWAALYQGRPIGESGGFFQLAWLSHEIEVRPVLVHGRVRYWDPAASKRQRAGDPDWAVGTLMSKIRTGPRDGAYCVEEIDRGRGTALETERRIIAAAQRDGRGVPIRIEQEPGSEAVLYIEYLKRLLAGFDVQGVQHGTNKATRARPFAAQCESGNVVFVRGPWLPQARDELVAFVGDGSEDHDDVPDSMTGAYESLAGSQRWPWQTLGAAGGRDESRSSDRSFGFDRGEFRSALDACAPRDALRDLARGGL